MENHFTVSQVSAHLGVSPTTIRRWDKAGKFKSYRHPINNYRVYDESSVNELKQDILRENNSNYGKIKTTSFTPFTTTENGNLYQADAIEFLKSLKSNSVDLIFADPPYNIKKAEWDTFSSQKEYVDWSMQWITEAHRVLTDKGSLYICGFSEILADLKWASSSLFSGCKWLIWFYRNKGNLGKDWGRSHESILHLRKSKNFIFHQDEVRIPYNEHTTKYPVRKQGESSHFANGKKVSHEWEPNPLGAKPKDVIEIPTISNGSWEKTIHNTQKPIELLRKIILSSSNEDSLILDPFGGSGTTYVVAEAYKRKWIGTELEQQYCELISNRVNDLKLLDRIRTAQDSNASNKRRIKLRG
jgi:site-specific DNA-methyltransferase (adenine-specific)